jgi:hypothetical protein
MTNVKDLLQALDTAYLSEEEKLAALSQIESTIKEIREKKEGKVKFNVQIILDEIKKIKADVQAQIEYARSIVPERGPKGDPGERGKDGVIGKDGRDGRDGKDGRDGADGQDGVSVTDAKIDFDGSLVITLSTGREINVGEVVPFDVAEKIRVITSNGGYNNGGGGASLPDQTGNAGEFLTTDGTNASWGPAQKTITSGTAAPSGGVDGDIYLQFV